MQPGLGLFAALIVCAGAANAQTLTFSQETDTVSIAGYTTLPGDCTFEARILPTTLTQAENIWREIQGNYTDKRFGIGPTEVYAYIWPASLTIPFTAYAQFTVGVWHHVAYVKHGTTESLYLDGNLIGTRACGQTIGNGTNPVMFMGFGNEDGMMHYAPIGQLDMFRVSSIARYSGSSFTPPGGDLATDANTQILYDFNDPIGSTTITDLSGNGHTGTLGTGEAGGTAPQFLGTALYPSSFSIPRGVRVSGGLSDLLEQDGHYVFIQPGLTLGQNESPAQLVVNGTWTGTQAPSSLQVVMVSAASTPNLIQTVDMFNFVTGRWERIGQGSYLLNDTRTTIMVSGDLSRFFNGLGSVSMCLSTFISGPLLGYPWNVRFDEVRWQATP